MECLAGVLQDDNSLAAAIFNDPGSNHAIDAQRGQSLLECPVRIGKGLECLTSFMGLARGVVVRSVGVLDDSGPLR